MVAMEILPGSLMNADYPVRFEVVHTSKET